jgi:hypothetical protein
VGRRGDHRRTDFFIQLHTSQPNSTNDLHALVARLNGALGGTSSAHLDRPACTKRLVAAEPSGAGRATYISGWSRRGRMVVDR